MSQKWVKSPLISWVFGKIISTNLKKCIAISWNFQSDWIRLFQNAYTHISQTYVFPRFDYADYHWSPDYDSMYVCVTAWGAARSASACRSTVVIKTDRVTRAALKQKLAPSDISPCGPLKEAHEIKNKNSCVPNNNKRGSEKLKACRRAVGWRMDIGLVHCSLIPLTRTPSLSLSPIVCTSHRRKNIDCYRIGFES